MFYLRFFEKGPINYQVRLFILHLFDMRNSASPYFYFLHRKKSTNIGLNGLIVLSIESGTRGDICFVDRDRTLFLFDLR